MKKQNKKGAIAITQIVLLLVSIVAISWMVGSEIKTVSADGGEGLPNIGESCGNNGVCYRYVTIRNQGDSCVVNSKEGTVQTGLCAGDDHVRCCVPTQTTTPETSSDNSDGGGNNYLDTVKGLAQYYVTYKGVKAMSSAVSKETVTETVGGIQKVAGVDFSGVSGPTSSAPVSGIKAFLFGGNGEGIGGGVKVLGSEVGGVVLATAVWAGIAFVAGRYIIGPLLGLNTYNSQVVGYSLAAGAIALIATSSTIIGVAVAVTVTVLFAKKTATEVVSYTCYQWDSKVGGADCEKCNNQNIPCTEYQCHSLGQGCEFSVDQISGQSLCQWENPKDLKAPTISPRTASLTNTQIYRYTPDNSFSPPDKGVKIEYTLSSDGCAPAWTPISFGITLDERARCKYSPGIIFNSYEEMPDLYLGNGNRGYNFTWASAFPGQSYFESDNNTLLENGGVYDIYIRCQDGNGNSNPGNYDFHFCIQQGPDTLAPVIDHVSPLDKTPIASGQKSVNATVYVNEPSECRWSHQDKSYELMEGNMTCSTSLTSSVNAQMLFPCKANLDGLKDNQNNDFYFRCKDQPQYKGVNESLRNTNQQSYPYRLVGTEALIINSVQPNNTVIKDSTTPVPVSIKVITALGYDNGKAVCSLSQTGASGSYVDFFYGYTTDRYSQYQHTQELNLNAGNYSYYVRCCDLGQNCDVDKISFGIETDLGAPEVVRIYKEDSYLKIITDEKGKCVYSTTSCAYDYDTDGISMSTVSGGDDTQHYTNWNLNTNYYIKCEDSFGNRPSSNQCSIIARPFEIPELK